MAHVRYNIIRLEVDRAGQIIRFGHKIPSYLKRCTGFKAVHVRGATKDFFMPEIGWLTASFNSLKEEAIATAVSCQSYDDAAEHHEFQMLDVALRPNQQVVGVYVDTMKAEQFSPYKVSLYLRCTDELIETTNEPCSII